MRASARAAQVALLVVTLVAGVSCDQPSSGEAAWTAEAVAETRHRGDRLVELLDDHRRRTGKYPAKLADLGGDDLLAPLVPTVGPRQWHYGSDRDGLRFGLSVRAGRGARDPQSLYLTWLDAERTGARRGWVHDR